MRLEGWIFLGLSWAFIIVLMVGSYMKIFACRDTLSEDSCSKK